MRRNAFTAIELLIAIALGATLCATAFSAVRLAASSLAVSNRLSLENGLLRSGFSAALEEVDFWALCDDPADPTRQPLRSAAVPFGSDPFRPLSFDPRGDQSDPRAWWRGMPTAIMSRKFGDYSRFAKCGYASTPVARPAEDAMRRWLPETMRTLNQTLGHYGLIDYLPANAVYQYFDESGASDSGGAIPAEFCDPSALVDPAVDPRLYLAIGGNDQARDIEFVTFSTAFPVTTDAEYLRRGVNRAGFADYELNGIVAPDWRTVRMHARCPLREDLLALRPPHWPDVEVAVRRFFYYARSVHLAAVTLRDPLSGAIAKLQFTATGSTLRGARQQRGLDTYVTPGAAP